MDRNLWTAIALSIAVYAVWFGFFEKKVNPPIPKTIASAPAVPGAPAATGAAVPAPDAKQVLAEADPIKLGEADALVAPRGAALAGFSFQGPMSRVELVADPAAGLFATFPELDFRRDKTAKTGFVYAAVRPDGVKITKEYLPGQGTVLPRLVVVATNPSSRPVTLPPWTLTIGPLGTVPAAVKTNFKESRVITLVPGAKHIDEIKPGAAGTTWSWLAVENRYFLAAVMPSMTQFEPASVPAHANLTLTTKPVTLAARGMFSWEIPYYVGPKSHAILSPFGLGLEKSIDYGILRDIGRPIFSALTYLRGLTGNWGWAIICLTLCLQVFMMPLTYKSLKAASAMRLLQPEVAKLQARYKDDAPRLNTEMMALYKKKGANPLGGCLPMLMQMPLFYSLYRVLNNSWELHGAGWIFWIHDLSAKDPYYVLPVVMGGLMFAQSKLNPPAGDPTQQQMMMFMPLIFTVMFAQASSGLVLYWLMNSLVSTLLQLALRKRLNTLA
ncbi:MAG: membrane protein insertase YidC [Elusimicrobia bacterium]|nr:membrane protein insertase YidC [Elusimicrobiota bacterium]